METLAYLASFWAVAWTVLAVFIMSALVGEDNGKATFVFCIVALCVLQLSWLKPFTWAGNHPGELLGWISIYLLIGVLWSYVRWAIHVRSRVSDLRDGYNDYCRRQREQQPSYAGLPVYRDLADYAKDRSSLSLHDNSSRIGVWVLWWPFSVLSFFVTDVVRNLGRAVVSMSSGVYNSITRSVVG